MAYSVVEFDGRRTSAEVLALILRGSEFAALMDARGERLLRGIAPVAAVPCFPGAGAPAGS
jgi:hypothetical protein